MEDKQKKFSKIYDKYIKKIYRFVFLKVNSKENTEDLCSETFSRCWNTFKNGDEIKNIQAFLYQIARNLITDYYREKGRMQIVSFDSVFLNDSLSDQKENLEEKFLTKMEIEEIQKVLKGLNEDYQNIIIWHYLDDLSIKETAELLGRTEKTTRVLLHRALNALRASLNSKTQ